MVARIVYVENMKLELDKLNEDRAEPAAWPCARRAAQWEALDAASEHQWMSAMNHTRDAFVHAFQDFKART